MPYSYIEHTADIGIRAEGKDLSEVIGSAAQATLNVMHRTDSVTPSVSITFSVDADETATLVVEVLNELLFIQDRHGLSLKGLKVLEIKEEEEYMRLIGVCTGEKFDAEKHGAKTEVKAATYSGLKYEEGPKECIFECLLDV